MIAHRGLWFQLLFRFFSTQTYSLFKMATWNCSFWNPAPYFEKETHSKYAYYQHHEQAACQDQNCYCECFGWESLSSWQTVRSYSCGTHKIQLVAKKVAIGSIIYQFHKTLQSEWPDSHRCSPRHASCILLHFGKGFHHKECKLNEWKLNVRPCLECWVLIIMTWFHA